MQTRILKLFAFVLLALLAAAVVALLQVKDSAFGPAPAGRIRVGQTAPDFAFPTAEGKVMALADLRGKVVFLNVWATWCPPCRQEIPSMERLYRRLRGEGLEILAVSIDAGGAADVVPFVREQGMTFPVLLDPQGKIRGLYGLTGVPESFLIDKKGVVRKVAIGPLDWSAPEVLGYFQELLKE